MKVFEGIHPVEYFSCCAALVAKFSGTLYLPKGKGKQWHSRGIKYDNGVFDAHEGQYG